MIDIINIINIAIILAVSIGLHEYAHAAMSYSLGDPTPKLQNRLTPNPLAHIDPIGFLMIFIVKFGWGKPVIVNPAYYKNPLRDELLVALAGPITNLLLGIFGIIIVLLYGKFILNVPNSIFIFTENSNLILKFWMSFSIINFGLTVFNMIPLPPLDGFRLIKFYKPTLAQKMLHYEPFLFPALIIIILLFGSVISLTSSYIYMFFYNLLTYLIF